MTVSDQTTELRKILNILDDSEAAAESLINRQGKIKYEQEESDKKNRQEEEQSQLLMKEEGKRNG